VITPTLILPHQGGGEFLRELDAPQLCCGVLHLQFKKTKNLSSNLMTQTGIPKKSVRRFVDDKPLENTAEFLFLV
jgi:hypothetical protein